MPHFDRGQKKNTVSLYDITSRHFPEQLSSAESWTTDVTVRIRRSGASAWTVLVAQQADGIGPIPLLSALAALLALSRDRDSRAKITPAKMGRPLKKKRVTSGFMNFNRRPQRPRLEEGRTD